MGWTEWRRRRRGRRIERSRRRMLEFLRCGVPAGLADSHAFQLAV
jgi:hypothetical protein